MEDIVWYGNAIKNENRLANVIVSLMNNKKLRQEGINCPFYYILSPEDVKEFSKNTFPFWPVNFKVAHSFGPVHYPNTLVDSITELKKKVSEVEKTDPNATILISLPIRTNSYYDFFYYIAHDYAFIHYMVNNDSHMVACDNSDIFNRLKLDPKLVYRFVGSVEDGLWIDNVVDYDDERLKLITKVQLNDVFSDPEKTREYRLGYRNGFYEANGQNFLFPEQVQQNHYIGDVFNSGYMTGAALHSIIKTELLENGFSFDDGKFDTSSLLIFRALSSDKTVKRLDHLSKLHNNIVSDDKALEISFVRDILKDLVSSHNGSLNLLLSQLHKASIILQNKKQVRPDTYNDKKDLIENFKSDEKCTITRNVKFEMAQFRVLANKGSSLEMRFQATNLKAEILASLPNVPPQVISQYSCPDPEIGLIVRTEDLPSDYMTFNDYAAIVSSLAFEQPSKAGTNAKYASLMVDGEFLKEIKTGAVVCELSHLFSSLKKTYGINMFDKPQKKKSNKEKFLSVSNPKEATIAGFPASTYFEGSPQPVANTLGADTTTFNFPPSPSEEAKFKVKVIEKLETISNQPIELIQQKNENPF